MSSTSLTTGPERLIHLCTQISDSWFQKREKFWSLITQNMYSLIPDPPQNRLISITWLVIPDSEAGITDPISDP